MGHGDQQTGLCCDEVQWYRMEWNSVISHGKRKYHFVKFFISLFTMGLGYTVNIFSQTSFKSTVVDWMEASESTCPCPNP